VTKPHATIIGAGIVGISAAAFLQRQGFAVTVIDRVAPGEGCSFGNAGGLAFAEVVPTVHPRILLKVPGWLMDPLGPLTIRWSYLPTLLPWLIAVGRNAMPDRVSAIIEARALLGLRVVADFETLLKAAGCHDLMVYQDTLRVFDTERQFAAEASDRAIKETHGYPVKRLSGDEVREIEPAISPHIACGHFHGGWYFIRNPGRLVKTLAEQVVRDGGTIIADDVVKIVVENGKAIQLALGSGHRHDLDRLVICAGAYSARLATQLGDRVLLEAERGYHMMLPNPGISLSRSITYARTPAAATPMEMGLRLAGTDELAGLDAPPNYDRADALWANFKHALPGLNPPDAETTRWMGRRPGTPDSLPVIGPSLKVSNAWYGLGHSHMGLAWGPTTGRFLSELMAGFKPNADLSPFRVNRF
jgi:D-amino-acid dehydrogenase